MAVVVDMVGVDMVVAAGMAAASGLSRS
jgi:hypothetical protein